jgi:hypothetical protein
VMMAVKRCAQLVEYQKQDHQPAEKSPGAQATAFSRASVVVDSGGGYGGAVFSEVVRRQENGLPTLSLAPTAPSPFNASRLPGMSWCGSGRTDGACLPRGAEVPPQMTETKACYRIL